mmetsp:Transcript_51105/g.153574  ORF Transcript_51105/g.153574 Transcript_51105/m.153574 type:complete len:243 (-) Transcript_51105:472-1200(-)|eukprot:CAMPEP_0113562262 /NCGR_PEP_ID=MMETSP0015_2-20120614/20428_1 /TAXON_ID=2838 /ORGANISM="Odontella" /LENGTH=242 /DNA_ID=CAMNT_0000464137 /DNA_START=240 /DNA_END=968 /DNA_ORIENTATION=+ /assembly_acc=CAM_ASM_000160
MASKTAPGERTTVAATAATPTPAPKSKRKPKAASKAKAKATPKAHRDRPAQPLSAYNIFFRYERARLILISKTGQSIENLSPVFITKATLREFLKENPDRTPEQKRKRAHRKTHGAVSFIDLSRIVGANWKALDAESKKPFNEVAHELKVVHYRKLEEDRREAKRLKLLESGGHPPVEANRFGIPTPAYSSTTHAHFYPQINNQANSTPHVPTSRSATENEAASLLLHFSANNTKGGEPLWL